MNALKSSPLRSSVFALALTAAALVVSLLIRPYMEPNTFLLFIVAAWLSAWYYGRAGGLTATGASAVAILYFFLRPDPEATAPSWTILAPLIAFVLMASLITWMTASWRSSRRLLSSALSSIADALMITDREGRISFLNPAAETLTGWTRQETQGRPADEVLRLVNQRTREAIENPLTRVMRERILDASPEHSILMTRAGAEVPIEHIVSPVRDEAGQVRGAILVFRDISNRLQLQEQATHALKMDAVERLAGSVAGDVNNVLTVIAGYAELLRAEAAPGSAMRRFADEIIHAGERAASLTHHLLDFSRGSAADPGVIDLNSVVTGMESMLRRFLGQNIELILLTTPHLGRVRADSMQIEQAILNLAANSRDAMPQGGKLVVETANVDLENEAGSRSLGVKPGSYVMLAVSDTGTGMSPETRARIFEPFFTTKAPGKGSGLGLATVYRTVRQAEGHVTVYSQPGCGTIFEIYLPRVKEVVAAPLPKRSAKGSETILLVDDEEGVRKLVHAVLQSNGYEVMEASNGDAALAAYEKNAHKIDMVLTDVVMPRMNGFELGHVLTDRAPALKILYMSGYRDNAPAIGEGAARRAFLNKPFTPDALLAKVREVLDEKPA